MPVIAVAVRILFIWISSSSSTEKALLLIICVASSLETKREPLLDQKLIGIENKPQLNLLRV